MEHIIQIQTSTKNKTLADLSSDIFILILQLRSTNRYGNAYTLKSKINDLFDLFQRNARHAGFDNEKINQAKFALVAFLDETIICSEWDQKSEWLAEPLQLKWFSTFNAGEEFFINMRTLQQRTTANKEVLEIYFLCLVLGFKGKYQLQSPENLRRVIDDLNLELHPDQFRMPDSISPHGKPQGELPVMETKSMFPVWIIPALSIVVCLVLYWILSGSIDKETELVLQSIQSLIK